MKGAGVTGAKINRTRGLEAAFFAAQTGEDLIKREIAASLGQQAHGIEGYPLAASKFQHSVWPIEKAVR